MKSAEFRFYEELNDFLPKNRRKVSFKYPFSGQPKIRDVLEMLGVPSVEVDLILINGISVTFDYQLNDGDSVSVYPIFESINIAPINHLRPKPLRQTKFILDVHLGRLTKYLRICGFDCYYENLEDDAIIEEALKQKRIILSKDKGLLKNKKVTHGYWVRARDSREQLLEVFNYFDLLNDIHFLTRCLLCNNKLETLSKENINQFVSEKTAEFYDIFYFCSHCNKIYWEGSHYKNMYKLIEFVKKTLEKNSKEKDEV